MVGFEFEAKLVVETHKPVGLFQNLILSKVYAFFSGLLSDGRVGVKLDIVSKVVSDTRQHIHSSSTSSLILRPHHSNQVDVHLVRYRVHLLVPDGGK